jgi:hypothetical protein
MNYESTSRQQLRSDYRLLSMATDDTDKFALEIGLQLDEDLNEAFERGIQHDWFTLVDVGPIALKMNSCFRIFKLTLSGRKLKASLQEYFR